MIDNFLLLKKKLLEALSEDVGYGDITTNALIPDDVKCKAQIISEEEGVIAGLDEVQTLLNELGIKHSSYFKDGDFIRGKNQLVMELDGSMRKILLSERTILNFLMRMSGIASATNKLLNKARKVNPGIRIASTRKTTPLLNYFDKKAVELGGGDSHRFRLDDCVLVKDNHLAFDKDFSRVIKKIRSEVSFTKKIEVEVENKDEALEAAKSGADIIMLDNMSPIEIEETIRILNENNLREKLIIEASGGINQENIVEYAKTGVDVISVGAITHSVKAFNLKMEIKKIY